MKELKKQGRLGVLFMPHLCDSVRNGRLVLVVAIGCGGEIFLHLPLLV